MRKKKQPTADAMRTQLALAADEIIRLRFEVETRGRMVDSLRAHLLDAAPPSWWRRLLAWVGS